MKKFGMFLLWLAVLVVLALASWGLALYRGWPLWSALAVFLGVLAAWFLGRFLRRLWIVMRSRSKMTGQSEAHRAAMAKIASPEALLTRKWKDAVATLRTSSLKRLGNPLYVLPWYMVIGRSGTGKTTALTRSRLASPIQKVSQGALIERTLNCDWWYFDQAVVIDCAGRYIGAEDLDADKREWEVGLDLLAKYRAREGLNGLVLAVSVERLAEADRDALDEEGRVIRARIEQLIRLFGKRFPIYVLVTKCDRLYGMESWARQLPESMLEQAMGYLADEYEGERKEISFLDDAFGSIGARLKTLRLALVARGVDVTPDVLLFPNELERLRPVLQGFLQACLGSNPYLESPFLRGLFFSSGMQQGGAVSALMGEVMAPLPAHPEHKEGLFLHDFFGRVLPQDRHAGRPAALVNQWYRVTQNLGLASWLLLATAIGVLMSITFLHNLDTVTELNERYPFKRQFTGKLEQDAQTMERMSDVLQAMERRNDAWHANWMIQATNVDTLEARLKQDFVASHRKYIQSAYAHGLDADLARLLAGDPAHQLPGLIRNQVRRVNLVQERIGGAEREQLGAMPQSVFIHRYTPQVFQRLGNLYLSHLAWSASEDPYLRQMLRSERAMLDRLDTGTEPPLGWLVELVANDGLVAASVPADFWKLAGDIGQRDAGRFTTVAPGFTSAGSSAINATLAELERSAEDGQAYQQRRRAFQAWYQERRLQAWLRFIVDFPSGEQVLDGEAQWRSTLGALTAPHSPYYRLIDRLTVEFTDLPEAARPEWLAFAYQFAQLRDQARGAALGSKAVRVVGALNSAGGQALQDAVNGAPRQGGQAIRDNLAAVDSLRRFLSGVDQTAALAIGNPGKAYQVAADFHTFTRDPNAKPSLVHGAADALAQFKRVLRRDSAQDEPLWRLIEGPFHFMLSYAQQQAACYLQQEWEDKVQFPLQAALGPGEMIEQLYGQRGTVWAFADGAAKPFLQRDAAQFRIVDTLGYAVPFSREFLPMLNGAIGKRVDSLVAQHAEGEASKKQALQDQLDQLQAAAAIATAERNMAAARQQADALKAQAVPLTIVALPTNVSAGARAKVYATVLTLQCGAGARTLSNFNAPARERFSWTMDSCGAVSLQIKIEQLVLTRTYPGPTGLLRFLDDFRDGERRFQASEFPEARARLEALGVNDITLQYQFEGAGAVLSTAQQVNRLLAQESTAAASKQAAQDGQSARQQQAIALKLAASGNAAPGARVALPSRVAVCWDRLDPLAQAAPVRGILKEMADAAILRNAAGAAPPVLPAIR